MLELMLIESLLEKDQISITEGLQYHKNKPEEIVAYIYYLNPKDLPFRKFDVKIEDHMEQLSNGNVTLTFSSKPSKQTMYAKMGQALTQAMANEYLTLLRDHPEELKELIFRS